MCLCPLLCALSRAGLSSMSFLCQTFVLALRSLTDFLKVSGTADKQHSKVWSSALQQALQLEVESAGSLISYFFTRPLIKTWPGQLWNCISMQCMPPASLDVCVGLSVLFCSAFACYMFLDFFFVPVSVISQGDKPFQWEFVQGLLENAIYGGRIDNPYDLRILHSYLEQFFSTQLLSSSMSAAQRRSRGGARFFPPQISLPNSCSILVIVTHGGEKHSF